MMPKSYSGKVIALAAVMAVMWVFQAGAVWANPKTAADREGPRQSFMSTALLNNLGIKTSDVDARGLMKEGTTVTGEVADPEKLAGKGFDKVKEGDKVEISHVQGKKLEVKHLASGKTMPVEFKSLFGEGRKKRVQ